MCGKPNIIIFSTDDLGYGDLGCLGSEYIKTPNIDSLGEEGIQFNNWYSNRPVCSPSRASLLTGKYLAIQESDLFLEVIELLLVFLVPI